MAALASTPQREAGSVTVRYAKGGESLRVNLLMDWGRADVPAQVMSNSSGPKDLTVNDVWELFQAHPRADRVALVRGRGPWFYLLRASNGQWFDVTAEPVIVQGEL